MTRKECLDAAAGCVLKDRNASYGGPEDNFGRIARLWTAYTGTVLDGIDVAMMMALLKVARIRNNKGYEDGYIDLAGYAACGAELVGRAEAYRQSIEAAGEEYKKLRAEAEAQPEFKYGDKIQYRVTLPSVSDRIWVDGTYDHILPHSAGHMVRGGFKGDLVVVGNDDIRLVAVGGSEIKAEGCEELVLNEDRMRGSMPGIVPQDEPSDFDAPQTKEELLERIRDVNPAIFKGFSE